MSPDNDEALNVNANKTGDDLNNEELNETKIIEVEQQTKDQDPENVTSPSSGPAVPDQDDADLISWDSPSDPFNPLNWPSCWRWIMIILASFISFIAGRSSFVFAPALPHVEKEFHSSNEALGSFVITIFVLGMASGPLILIFAPLSELYGRVVIKHIGNVGSLLFTIAIAVSTTEDKVIVFRLFQGAFSSVCLTNGGSVIADTIPQQEQGFAIGMFMVGILAGPVVGSVPGSFLAAAKAGDRYSG